mgnify:FL=1
MKLALESGVPFLGELPIDPQVSECVDGGEPIVRRYPDSPVSQAYRTIAQTIWDILQRPQQGESLPSVQL